MFRPVERCSGRECCNDSSLLSVVKHFLHINLQGNAKGASVYPAKRKSKPGLLHPPLIVFVHCVASLVCVVSIHLMYSKIQMIAILAIVKDCNNRRVYKGRDYKRSNKAKSPYKAI